MDVLIVAATHFEIGETLRLLGFRQAIPPGSFEVFRRGDHVITILVTGIGIHNTTFQLTKLMSKHRYDLAVQAGIAGSFDTALPLGSVVGISSDRFGDLGIEDHDVYLDLFETGLAEKDGFPFVMGALPAPAIDNQLIADLPSVSGLTVNTVSGSAATIEKRKAKYNCAIESMEGAAFHFVCRSEKIPFAQIRAISNYVTPRDRSSWKMKEAIDNLNHWLAGFLNDTVLK